MWTITSLSEHFVMVFLGWNDENRLKPESAADDEDRPVD